MRIGITFLLLCFVCFAVSQPTTQQTTEIIIPNLQDGEVQLATAPFTAPETSDGYITVTITADFPVDVCFQEGSFGAGGTNLSVTCNSDGFIPGAAASGSASGSGSASQSASGSASGSSSDDAEFDGASTGGAKRLLRRFFDAHEEASTTTTTQLYIRTGTYTISAAWANQPDAPENSTQTGSVDIDISWIPCTQPGPIGPGCMFNPTKTKAEVANVVPFTAGTPLLFSFENTDDALLTLLTFIIAPPAAAFVENATTVQAWVRRDASPYPDSGLYDKSISGSSTSSDLIGFVNPEGGKWYLLVNTTQDMTLNITVQTNQGCNTTSGSFPTGTAGECVSAIPILAPGTTNQTAALFANGETAAYPQAAITYFMWNTSQLLVGVVNSDHSDEGAPLLFASTVGIPTSSGAEFSSVLTNSQVNFLNAQSSPPAVFEWIISVESPNQGFEIWAGTGCANNCSSIGTCDVDSGSNGLCGCPEHYKDFECGTKTLKTIYIVLIAIGGAIVLAIAIGVPVGCYIKNRKRARYERV